MINSVSHRTSTTASSATTSTDFATPAPIYTKNDIEVYVDSVKKAVDSQYAVTIETDNTANIRFTSGNVPADSAVVVIVRSLPYLQGQNFMNNDALDIENIETGLDKLTVMTQQLSDGKDYSFKFAKELADAEFNSETLTGTNFANKQDRATTLSATKATRANKYVGFDVNGDISVSGDIGSFLGNWATSTAYVAKDIVKDASNNNIYICNTSHSSSGSTPVSSNTDVAKWDLIVDAAQASTDATTATNKALHASRSEDNAEAYAQTAENTQTTVYADVTSSSTSNDGYSALHYREKAKEWAGTGTSHPLVTDDSGSNIAGEYSAKAWASKASGTVDGSTKSAKLSASDAATSESNAAGSATTAAASAAAVATALDSFDDKYLGVMADDVSAVNVALSGASCAKDAASITFSGITSGTVKVGQELTSTGTGYPVHANIIGTSTTSPITISAPFTSAISSVALSFTGQGVYGAWDSSKDGPSTDNDGDALVNGALYFNSTDGEMRVYDTSSSKWIAASAAQNATVLDYTYTLSGSDATISGSDDSSATLSFSSQESVDVFLNGVKLIPKIGGTANDYHLDTANTVTLTSTAVSGDVILVRIYKTFTVGDAVSAASGGTFSGNVSFGDNNITNVGSIALDSISADGTEITISSDIETATNKKIKQKGAFMHHSSHQAWVLGG